jgi:membrane associated rhomboid family serine protease
MGIHDRDYYRDDSGRWGAASAHRGVIALIAVITSLSLVNFAAREEREVPGAGGQVVFVNVLEEALRFEYPKIVPEVQLWRFGTSFLLTRDIFLGLIFGGLLLYFFGGELEILYGTGRFLTFFLLAGVLANVLKFLLALGNVGVTAATYGTSAPMFATMVLFAFHYPHRPIRIWFLLPIPVWVLVLIYLGINLLLLLGAVAGRSGEAIPHAIEPLVGAAVGFLYFRTRGRLFAFADVFANLFRKRRVRRSPANVRVYDEDDDAPRPTSRASSPPPPPQPVPQPAGGGVDEHLEAKLDAVLAKVARHGKGSLTPEENDILMRASEVFKKKRG